MHFNYSSPCLLLIKYSESSKINPLLTTIYVSHRYVLCIGMAFFQRDDFTPVLQDEICFFKCLGSKHSPSYEDKDAYKLELLHHLNFAYTMTTACKLSNG